MDAGKAQAWLEARKSGRLDVPTDRSDAEAWDRYWMAHLEVGPIETAFGDMMASDPNLLQALAQRAARTVLCVGAGLSTEPITLALHGFDVTALDLSQVPRNVFVWMTGSAEQPLCAVPGVVMPEPGALMFSGTGPIDSSICPLMHKSDAHPPRCGGALRYVVGNLANRELCPGPYDVVIERRTVQLFDASQQVEALACLEARLSERGLFISHEHQGLLLPGQRAHFASEWTEARGFVNDRRDSSRRAAHLFFSTG